MSAPRRRIPLVAAALAVAALLVSPPSYGAAGTTEDRSAKRMAVAVIGDVPYGLDQEAIFGTLIGAVNDDPKVRLVAHVGDIKSGSTTCTDERFATVRAAFDTFEDPLVYTPGDNEWTDCHRVNNGAYDPLERLAAVRTTFFPEPGSALGRRPKRVDHQAAPFVENMRWVESRVAFAAVHLIGSNNGLAPWSGLGLASPTPGQAGEVAARVAAGVSWVDAAFDAAEADDLAGVALMMQADTWNPAPSNAQAAVVARIATRAATFAGPVLVLQGDSHTFVADHPLSANVTRIVVHGETLPFEYLRVTVDPADPAVFRWERVLVTLP